MKQTILRAVGALCAFWMVVVALSGCSSLQNAGVSEYSVKPFFVGEEVYCCQLEIKSGREIANLTAHVKKSKDGYEIDLVVQGVKAFEGQAVSSATVGTVLPGINNSVTEWLKR